MIRTIVRLPDGSKSQWNVETDDYQEAIAVTREGLDPKAVVLASVPTKKEVQ